LQDPGVDGTIILDWILGKGWEDVNWIHLAEDRDGWRNLVHTVMNLRFGFHKGGEYHD